MKYCPRCKTRVPETATACATCGGPIRQFGTAPSSPAAASPAGDPSPTSQPAVASAEANAATPAQTLPPGANSPTPSVPSAPSRPPSLPPAQPPLELPGERELRLQLAGLEHEVARSGRWVAWTGAIVALLLLLLAAWLYDLRMREIRSFATLDQLELRAIPRAPLAAELVYRPTSAGKVEFIRVASESKETLVEHHSIEDTATRDPRRFSWTGADRDYKVLVRYRENGRIREQWFDPPQANRPPPLERGEPF